MRLIAGHDADRREGDTRAVEVETAGTDRLLEIAADAGNGDGPFGIGEGEVVKRLLDTLRAIVVGVIVGEPEQVEAGIDQRLERGRVTPEVERPLAPALGTEVVAVGHHGLEIDEGKIAIYRAGHSGKRVGEARHLLALVDAFGIDLGVGRIEAGIADEHDREAVGRGLRGRGLARVDRCGALGPIARRRARGGIEQAGGSRKQRGAGR